MNEYVILNGELYHHGVKGMKWGVRRAQKKAARAEKHKRIEKKLGKNNYKDDIYLYGRKGAERIYDRMQTKGISRRKAEMLEFGRQTATKSLMIIGASAVGALYVSGSLKAQQIRGKQAANASLLRLPKKIEPWKIVADLGSGVEVMAKLS